MGRVFAAVLLVGVLASAPARAELFGPTRYLSRQDTPAEFAGTAPLTLEDFEDGALNQPGVEAAPPEAVVFGPGRGTDSVDADDGTIDGSGIAGRCLLAPDGAGGITFAFDAAVLGGLPSRVGVVWTDGAGSTSFETFDADGTSLGTIGPVDIADGSTDGTTDEDRFFGIVDRTGIARIRLSNTIAQIEVDHLQFGDLVSVSSTTTTSTTTSSTASTATTTTSTTTTSTTTSTTTTTTTSTTTTTIGISLDLDFCALLDPSDNETPVKVVGGGVTDYWLHGQTVYWHDEASCPDFGAPDPERVLRIATYCGLKRTIFSSNQVRAPLSCNPYRIHSNVVADATHLYWVDDDGLVRLPVGANPGDDPEVVTTGIQASLIGTPIELVQTADHLWALRDTGNIVNTHTIQRAAKNGSGTLLVHSVNGAAGSLAADGKYLYYLLGGELRRLDPSVTPATLSTLTTGVDAYFAEGERTVCLIGFGCFTTDYVFIAKDREIFRWSNPGGPLGASIYTSPDVDGRVQEVTSNGSKIFFFETRLVGDGTRGVYLFRANRSGTNPDIIYAKEGVLPGNEPDLLRALTLPAGPFVFWRDAGMLFRLPGDLSEMALTDLRVTDIEVTQAIQDLAHSVPLVRNKRTFVRAFAAAAGPATAGVTARLYATWAGGGGGPLLPVNQLGTNLTVQTAPNRNNIDHSFVFKLPYAWTTHQGLTLRVDLNPDHYPLELDYANNEKTVGPFAFEPSSRLEVQFVEWGFKLNGTTYYPRDDKDIAQTYSWIRRAYPLASTAGGANDPSPGFRPSLWTVFDGSLGSRVAQTHPDCDELFPDVIDTKNLCASYYTNTRMTAMRYEQCLVYAPWNFTQLVQCIVEAQKVFFYGLIFHVPGYFPRGQACCGPKVSTGPASAGCCGADWDTDGAITDWYAGHEIGHTLGRKHPSKGNACGHSASDPNYPYSGALIGPNGGSLAGFDVGASTFGIAPAVYPRSQWADVMSYCNRQWVSDYTYEAMLGYLEANPSLHAGLARTSVVDPSVAGAFLGVFGFLSQDGAKAFIQELHRIDDPLIVPPDAPGTHHLLLVDAEGAVLGDHPFVPEPIELEGGASGGFHFGRLVPFAPGTREVRVTDSVGTVLGAEPISANPPAIDALEITPPPAGPVAGGVMLAWSASDPDGDPLTFDVFYSLNDGASFLPLLVNLAESSAPIDTNVLGGGTAILRLRARDGAHTVEASTPPFTVAKKAPMPHILEPGDGTQVQYGTLVTFEGAADDLQDLDLPGDMLVWTSQDGPLGQGAELPVADLPVGENVITLTATNSDGLSTSTSIRVIVGDQGTLPGPVLSVAPTQIAWHVAAGSGPVTADVELTNIGDGVLTWTAGEDAPWLTLSIGAGTVPGTLTLTADPTGIPDATSRATTITVNGLDEGGATLGTIMVPVALAVGNVWASEVCAPEGCADDDPCTRDSCEAGYGCAHALEAGIGSVTCACGTVPPACAGVTLPKNVTKSFARACRRLDDVSGAKPRRASALLKKAGKGFRHAGRQAMRAGRGRRPKLEGDCATALAGLFGQLRQRALDLRSQR